MLKNMFLLARTRKKALTLHRHLMKDAPGEGHVNNKNTN